METRRLYLPSISPLSRLYLAYISQARREEEETRRRLMFVTERVYISPISRPYLAYISPISRLMLVTERVDARLNPNPNPHPNPNPNPNPSP